MNLTPILRQTTSWQAATGTDDRGQPTYAIAVSLPCRTVDKSKNIIAKDGDTITVAASVTLQQLVSNGDLLDGREVVAVNTLVTVGGATIGYQALTR